MENKQLTLSQQMSQEVIKYEVCGEEVQLSADVIGNFVKRGNSQLTMPEIVSFMQLCKHRKLNPFTNEAYLVKFGNEAAQMLVGKEAFTRRAEENPNFDGYRAGIIVFRNKEVVELEGSFMLPTDQLIGGWCEVHIKGRKFPVVSKVSFKEYDKGQSTWKKIPGTMIRKTAIVQALREAFPVELGSLYVEDEMHFENENKVVIHQEAKEEIKEKAFKNEIDFEEELQVGQDKVIDTTPTIEAEVVEPEF